MKYEEVKSFVREKRLRAKRQASSRANHASFDFQHQRDPAASGENLDFFKINRPLVRHEYSTIEEKENERSGLNVSKELAKVVLESSRLNHLTIRESSELAKSSVIFFDNKTREKEPNQKQEFLKNSRRRKRSQRYHSNQGLHQTGNEQFYSIKDFHQGGKKSESSTMRGHTGSFFVSEHLDPELKNHHPALTSRQEASQRSYANPQEKRQYLKLNQSGACRTERLMDDHVKSFREMKVGDEITSKNTFIELGYLNNTEDEVLATRAQEVQRVEVDHLRTGSESNPADDSILFYKSLKQKILNKEEESVYSIKRIDSIASSNSDSSYSLKLDLNFDKFLKHFKSTRSSSSRQKKGEGAPRVRRKLMFEAVIDSGRIEGEPQSLRHTKKYSSVQQHCEPSSTTRVAYSRKQCSKEYRSLLRERSLTSKDKKMESNPKEKKKKIKMMKKKHRHKSEADIFKKRKRVQNNRVQPRKHSCKPSKNPEIKMEGLEQQLHKSNAIDSSLSPNSINKVLNNYLGRTAAIQSYRAATKGVREGQRDYKMPQTNRVHSKQAKGKSYGQLFNYRKEFRDRVLNQGLFDRKDSGPSHLQASQRYQSHKYRNNTSHMPDLAMEYTSDCRWRQQTKAATKIGKEKLHHKKDGSVQYLQGSPLGMKDCKKSDDLFKLCKKKCANLILEKSSHRHHSRNDRKRRINSHIN